MTVLLAIWNFLKSGLGQILAVGLGFAVLVLRMKFLENSRDEMKRKAQVAKSDAKVAVAKTSIGSAINRKRAEAAKKQKAKNKKAKKRAAKSGKRRDIGGDW